MRRRQVAVFLLSALLLFQQLSLPANLFAEQTSTSAKESVISNRSSDWSDQTLSKNDDPLTDESVSDDSEKSEDASGDPSKEGSSKNEDATLNVATEGTHEPISSIDYVYVEQSVVSLGEDWNIVVSLKDNSQLVKSAELVLSDSAGEKHTISSSDVKNGAVRFNGRFDEASDALRYTVKEFRYSLADESRHFVLLSDDSEASNDYSFDVVSPSTANALTDPDDDGVSAMYVDADGNLQAAGSVEEALEKADPNAVTSDADGVATQSVDSRSAVQSRENYLIVAIDPGHGGYDSGASANGVVEKDVNWSIANHFKDELATYTGVTPYLTTSGEEPGLSTRVDRAVSMGADVFISVHVNSDGGQGVSNGAEVWVPNNSSYNNALHAEGTELGQKIEQQLTSLGLTYRGVKSRDWGYDPDGGYTYPDGSMKDYYSVIRNSRYHNIPGIIVEHAFVTNASDAAKLRDDSFRKRLGIADATGVAQQYGLVKDSTARQSASVAVKAHVSNLGWESTVYDNKVAGTVGKGFGLEAFQLSLLNSVASSGGVSYRSNIDGSWQDWKSSGQTSGTTGQGKALQAVEIKLTGDAAAKYDIYYRVHSADFGWLGWTKNGASAGSVGYGKSAQAIEVVIVAKGSSAPGSTSNAFRDRSNEPMQLKFQAHVRNIGWMSWQTDSMGTTGRGLPMEALKVVIDNQKVSGSIESRAHVQDVGWQNWVNANSVCGTTGQSKQIEAVQFRLTGQLAEQYDIYYRVHVANIGWLGWAKNGDKAGSQGFGYGAESVQLKLVKKGGEAPGKVGDSFRAPLISCQAHVQNIGWQPYVYNGSVAGTTGRGLNLEALNVRLGSEAGSGAVQVKAHVSNIGWQNWTSKTAGTTGRNLAIEALQIKLTGDVSNKYDIYYRVHSADFGWFGWAKNGESAGSQGYGKGAQAVQVVLVEKGDKAPGSTENPFKAKASASTSKIMGSSTKTAKQMATYFSKSGHVFPKSVYSDRGASTIEEFCKILAEESSDEGVRADVVFAQAMHETGWLKFGGSVKAEQCNFAGIGATSATVGGASFKDVRTGIRAQVQHLKAYASKDALKHDCVDPRFSKVTRGSAPLVTDLNGKWAVPGNDYGESILKIIQSI